MKVEYKQKIKETVENKISEIESELQMLEEANKPISPDSAYGRISRIDAINNQSITETTLKDKKTTLHRLKYSLSKIDNEEYGKCYKCGKDINIKRIMSIPYASYCIDCANKFG
jgi:DnaK suppressor protein